MHIDIYDVQSAVRSGRLKVSLSNNGVYMLEDLMTRKKVSLNEVDGKEQAGQFSCHILKWRNSVSDGELK